MHMKPLLTLALACSAAGIFATGARADKQPAVLQAQTPIMVSAAPKRFDLLAVDGSRHRLLGAHEEAGTLSVIDLSANTLVREVPVGQTSGVAVDAKDGKYFVGTTRGVAVVDSGTLEKTGFVATPGPADAMTYDPDGGRLYVGHDDGQELWIIDARNSKITGSIAIPGVPEIMELDPGTHRLYLNIKDKNEVVAIDVRSGKVIATWPTPETDSPHGLAIDLHGGKLFVAGHSPTVSVFSLPDGKPLQGIDIGPGRVDQIAFDAATGRLYVPSSGRLVAVDTRAGSAIGSVAIAQGTHSVAVDPETHRVWIVYADKDKSYAQAFTAPAGGTH